MNVKKEDRTKIKDSFIRLRVTKAEVQKFKEKARQYNCDTISEYIRIRCLNEDDYKDFNNSQRGFLTL